MSQLKYHLLIAVALVCALTIATTIVLININETSIPHVNERLIDKKSFKGKWPFIVEKGMIRCDRVGQNKALSFDTLQGLIYALNTTAEIYSNKGNLGWQPSNTATTKSINGNVGDVIKSGLSLCVN